MRRALLYRYLTTGVHSYDSIVGIHDFVVYVIWGNAILKYILLGFINYQPMTGYAIKQAMERSTMYFWHAYHSQIYTTLRQLEEEGLLISEVDESDDRMSRRVYTITEEGQVALQEWLEQPMTERSPVKEPLLVRIFFSALRDPEGIADELRIQRTLHEEQLATYRDIERSEGHKLGKDACIDSELDTLLRRATLEFGLMYEELYVCWLSDLIDKLETK